MPGRHTVKIVDENGSLFSARRWENPDGTVGGWVANTARVHPTAHIEIDALVMPRATIGKDVRVFSGITVSSDVVLIYTFHDLVETTRA